LDDKLVALRSVLDVRIVLSISHELAFYDSPGSNGQVIYVR
jgi:hypothetical protein